MTKSVDYVAGICVLVTNKDLPNDFIYKVTKAFYENVITSYSIHYTKLYDPSLSVDSCAPMPVIWGWISRKSSACTKPR